MTGRNEVPVQLHRLEFFVNSLAKTVVKKNKPSEKISPEPKQSYKWFAQWRFYIMIDVSRHWSFYSKEISGNLKRKLMK